MAPGEEGDGAPATTNDATWRHRFFDTIFWTTEGGDFSGTVSASQSVGAVGMYTWSSSQMRADVQSWLDDPASNFGWLVLGDESEIATAKRFDTRESASPPVLTINLQACGTESYADSETASVSEMPRPTPVRFFSSVTLLVTVVRTASGGTICIAAGRLEKREGRAVNQSQRAPKVLEI